MNLNNYQKLIFKFKFRQYEIEEIFSLSQVGWATDTSQEDIFHSISINQKQVLSFIVYDGNLNLIIKDRGFPDIPLARSVSYGFCLNLNGENSPISFENIKAVYEKLFSIVSQKIADIKGEFLDGEEKIILNLNFEDILKEASKNIPREEVNTEPKTEKEKTVFDAVRIILADQLGADPSKIVMESSLTLLGADELDLVELVMTFEEEFDLEIDDEEAKFQTVGEVLDLINEKIKEKEMLAILEEHRF